MSYLLDSIEEMLRRRRNVQSKHGEQAAYSHEVFLLTEALEKLLDAQLQPSAGQEPKPIYCGCANDMCTARHKPAGML